MTVLQDEKPPVAKRVVKDRAPKSVQAPFHMANLYPRGTGLPMTVWVSTRARARHDARVKVCLTHGDSMDPSNLAVVAIRPSPRIVRGKLASRDFGPVAAWIALNEVALIDYWNGTIDTLELVARLQKLEQPHA